MNISHFSTCVSCVTVPLLTALILILSPELEAAERCPFIRPAGLLPEQVDGVVLDALSASLKTEQRELKQSDTIKLLKGEQYGMQCFGNFALVVGESLGFDASTIFITKAKDSGLNHPYESLTVEQFMQIARDEYFKGLDDPPPVVPPNEEYILDTISVRPPSEPKEWNLVQCKWDGVTFQAQIEGQRLATASIKSMTLPPFKNEKGFLVYANKEVKGSVPPQWKVRRLAISKVNGTLAPCVDIRGAFEQANAPMDLYGRFCYVDIKSKAGFGFMYMFMGTPFPKTMHESALKFVERASMR